MDQKIATPFRVLTASLAAMFIAAACSSATPTAAPVVQPTPITVTVTAPPGAQPTPQVITAAPATPIITPEPIAAGPGPNGGVVVRWFVGLGAGTQPANLQPEQKFVTDYNASQKAVYLSLEIIDNTQAANILKTEISAGTAPDIIGPVGVEGLNIFRDQVLDLAPLIASTGYTAKGVDQKLVDFFNTLGAHGATVGLPFGVYPSFIIYNKDLFDEAKLPLPPTKVGDQYDGKPWDVAALRDLAMKLTVDKGGNDATSPNFDPANVAQWGFESQFQDNFNARGENAFFGAGSFLAADGKTAQIPEYLSAGAKWFNDGVWKDHFIPNANEVASATLNAGSEFASGNIAMNEGHTWFTCCVTPTAPAKPFKFGFAINPTNNGTITSPLHADTFSILKSTKVPDAAFKALTAMVASGALLTTYGAMPADASLQDAWFKSIDATFPGIKLDWSVPQAMLAYPDIPNHQSFLPDYAKARAAFQAFGNKYRTTSGLDMDAELAALQTTLQGIFDQAAP